MDGSRQQLHLISPQPTQLLGAKITITKKFESGFWPLLKDGTLKPIIDTTFSIQQAQEAHQYVADNKNVGKVILKVESI